MTSEITPIENAFEFIGLHQSAVIMKYIFMDTMAGKLIFLFGMMIALARVLKKGDLKPLVMFWGIFFSLFFLFVIPSNEMLAAGSVMEERGNKTITTAAIIKEGGLDHLKANPLAVTMTKGMNALMNGVLFVLDQARPQKAGYLDAPFLWAHSQTAIKALLAGGVQDPVLNRRVTDFYKEIYFETLTALQDKDGKDPMAGLWPGDPRVTALYSSDAKSQWDTLQQDLYRSQNKDGVLDPLENILYSGEQWQSSWTRSLLENDIVLKPELYSKRNYDPFPDKEIEKGPFRPVLGDRFIEAVINGRAYCYGMILLGIWLSFPVVIIAACLLSDGWVLMGFVKTLFLVKFLPVIWSGVDTVSMIIFHLCSGTVNSRVYIWQMTAPGMVAAVGILAAPLLLWAVLMQRHWVPAINK